MRTENEEIRDHLKYLSLLARDYPSQAAAASEIISTQALLKLPTPLSAWKPPPSCPRAPNIL